MMRLSPTNKNRLVDLISELHYSPIMPRLTKHYLGCYVDDKLVGGLTFGWGTRPKHTIQKMFPEVFPCVAAPVRRRPCPSGSPATWLLTVRETKDGKKHKKVRGVRKSQRFEDVRACGRYARSCFFLSEASSLASKSEALPRQACATTRQSF